MPQVQDRHHGPSIADAGVAPGDKHDQAQVIAATELSLQRMKAGTLHVTPIIEYPSELHGKKGMTRVFFATGD